MSYARFGEDSNVYVFLSCSALECCSCRPDGPHLTFSTAEMIAHLDEHRAAGDKVPDYCYEGLREDERENDHHLGVTAPSFVDLDAAWG
jgi:hypothetical protein